MDTENYYDQLAVSQTATVAEIRKAYIKKIRQYTNEAYPEEFKFYTKAYKILENPEKRKQHDISIQSGGKYQESIEKIQDFFNKELYSSAMDLINEMINIYPNDAAVLNLQAECYLFQKKYADVEIILNRLLKMYPQNELYLSQLASLYFFQEKYDEAINLYEQLVIINPEENQYYFRLSNCLLNSDHLEKACQVLENKLLTSTETIYDFPFLSELYFLTVLSNNHTYHENVINRIESLAKNSKEQEKLLNLMIKLAIEINTDHYLFKELTHIIKKMNRNLDTNVSSWVAEAEKSMDPNTEYYGDLDESQQANIELQQTNIDSQQTSDKPSTRVETRSSENSSDPIRGSILWSFVFGIIASFFLTPFGGIIVGVVWYFLAEQLKTTISCLGCLTVILIVLAVVLDSCGL